jgi:hypothetical protein
MRIKIDFYDKIIYNLIETDFPLDIIHDVMKVIDWRYYTNSYESPSKNEIKQMLFSLIDSVKPSLDGGGATNAGSGGFDVTRNNYTYNVKFIIDSHFFTNKSDLWDETDLLYYYNFIKRIFLTYKITNSLFCVHSLNDSLIHFKRRCNAFIDSNKSYDYNKEMGLLFTKEEHNDSNTLYKLEFIGVDKDYQF